jgi:tripartite-type tricarboxylate transporter receptor subunit TctC
MKSVACTIAIAALIAGMAPAISQTFPTRNITILVPYAPGGPTDAAARIVGEHMAATFGQHVLIENVTGGSGAGTPGFIIERLNQALRLALADPKVIKSFAVNEAAVFPPVQQTPEAATRMVHAEIVRWGDIIRANRIEATQ